MPFIKIPVSKLRKELDLEHGSNLLGNDSEATEEELADDRLIKTPFLNRFLS